MAGVLCTSTAYVNARPEDCHVSMLMLTMKHKEGGRNRFKRSHSLMCFYDADEQRWLERGSCVVLFGS